MVVVVLFLEIGSCKVIFILENGEKVDLFVKKGMIFNVNFIVINNNVN